LDQIKPPNYIPTFEDLLYVRSKTIGIYNIEFTFNHGQYKLLDVGGQRNERKKWKNVFNSANIVIYVVGLSDYTKLCYEDDKTNRMDEALNVFEEVINFDSFKNATIILLLNKYDKFVEKLKTFPLKNYFKDYDGDDNEKAFEFLKKNFLKKM